MTTPPHGLPPPLDPLPLRLRPGDDLRHALESELASRGFAAAFVLAGIGSLRPARLRWAGAPEACTLDTELEVLTMSGTVARQGSHLHLSVAAPDGTVRGGHAAYGCIVRTTAEVLLLPLPGWQFSREPDATTGWDELVMRRLG